MHPTLLHAVFEKAEALASRPVLWRNSGSAYHPLLWRDFATRVRRCARGLLSLGLEPGANVCVLGTSEWPIALLGVMAAGGAPALLDERWPDAVLLAAIRRTGARLLLVERDYYARAQRLEKAVAGLCAWGIGDGTTEAPSLEAALARPDAASESAVDERMAALTPGSRAAVLFTSGTTAEPKAVAVSHQSLLWTTEKLTRVLGFGEAETVLSLLPPALAAAQTVGLHLALRHGAQVYLPRSGVRPIDLLREVRPTVVLAPPRAWERFARTIEDRLSAEPPKRQKVEQWARGLALERNRREAEQQSVAPSLAARCRLAATLVHDPLKLSLGLNRTRVLACVGGPAGEGIGELFASLAAPLYEVYGQAETCGVSSVLVPEAAVLGTQGRPLPGLEVRLSDEGVFSVRGGNVCLGALEQGEGRPLADADGWWRTGDSGRLSTQGLLEIDGRVEELLTRRGGAKTAPRRLEERLRRIRLVCDAMIVGEQGTGLAALLTLEPDAAARFAVEHALPDEPARFIESSVVRGWIAQQIDQVNRELSEEERIVDFALLPEPFSVADGELSSSGALRREAIAGRHARRIAELCATARTRPRPLTA